MSGETSAQNTTPGRELRYDGAECMRLLSENPRSKHRPRGFSCEELGTTFIGTGMTGTDWSVFQSTSRCSSHHRGQAAHFLPMEDVIRLLAESLSQ